MKALVSRLQFLLRLRLFSRLLPSIFLWSALTPLLEAQTTTVFTNSTLIGTNSTYDGQDIVVDGCVVTVSGVHAFNSVTVTNGAVLSHQATTIAQAYSMTLTITNNLFVDATSKIDASARGYLPGYTTGNSTNDAATKTAGGSYGGLGAVCCNSTTDPVYGDFRNPNDSGSGSGNYNGGAAGGGLVQLTAATAQIDGSILANGQNGYDGGSGGGILLTAGALSGAGEISANGGIGSGNDGGGGGRVAIYYTTSSFDLVSNVTANAGIGATGASSVGTVYLQQMGGPGQLVIDNHGTPVGLWTPLGSATDTAVQVDSLIVSGTNVVAAPEHQMPILTDFVSVTNGGVLTHQVTTTFASYSLVMTVTNSLLVDAASSINASARGYLPGYTLGNTNAGGALNTAGGSYGGLGGLCCNSTTDPVYGDYHNPNELGSGSGVYNSGAAGGGLIQITAGAATVDGAILADGGTGYDGGSGGGILLTVGALSGAGQIDANGGGSTGNDGGGGGRIAIYYTTSTFDLSSNVTTYGGVAPSVNGSAGTVYLQQGASSGQLIINNNGKASPQLTPLGTTNDLAFTADNLVISGAGTVAATISGAPLEAESVSVINGGLLTHQPTTAEQAYTLVLTITNNLLVDGASSIDVSGRGYTPGYTLGNTTVGGAVSIEGGSYGGLGAQCCSGTTDPVYGDFRNPSDLGSGSGPYNSGGAGGGLVQVTVGTAQVDGAILANGGNNYDGGSGGGILLNAVTLSGAGKINANGGHASGNYGGGGGRVAIYFATNTFNISSNVTANGGSGASGNGSVGTVYLQQSGGPGQLVIDNHGTPVGQWTPLGQASDTTLLVDVLIVSGTNVVAAPEHQMPIAAGSVSITNGAVLTHQITTTAASYSLLMTISNTLFIDGTSSIDVSGRGYVEGYTQGNTSLGGALVTAGGSYGGLGGLCCSSTTDPVYGDYLHPNDLGSGAGIYNTGGAGGGLVQITAGTAQIYGAILANGGNGYGGGSGGGILLTANNLIGSGHITANGGNASGNDGGGGGRVAIYYGNSNFGFSSNAAAFGGHGLSASGSAGTLYLQQGNGAGQLVINNNGTANAQLTPLGHTNDSVFSAGNLVLSGPGTVAATISGAPMQVDSLSLVDGAVLTHQPTTPSTSYSLVLTVTNNLVVDAASSINVSGLGYLPGYTLGNTTLGAANNTAGGSYGGLGGLCCGSSSDSVYGDYRHPNDLGSGSGTYNTGAAGGGLVQITAGTIDVDGSILANGSRGYDGGSGGGILLSTGTISGAGRIDADGGSATGNDGGGGGRVAIFYNTSTFDLSSNVTADAGYGPSSTASVGTVFLQQTGDPGLLVIDNHGLPVGRWTPLGQATDTVFQADELLIRGTNVVAAAEHQMPISAGSITITNGGDLTTQPTTPAQVYSLVVTVTNSVLVDASSTINVSGLGYLTGYTQGDSTVGAANFTAGGSYGGLGGLCCGSATDPVYGDYYFPNDVGSGSGPYNGGASGGGLIQITAPALQLDGTILANGANGYDGASGGGVLLNLGALNGAGQIAANGGHASGNDGGGGGRVAIYTWGPMNLAASNVTANGGTGPSTTGGNGSVYITGQPFIRLLNVPPIWHGAEQIAWSTFGINPAANDTAQIVVSKGGSPAFKKSVPTTSSLTWDTTSVADGSYTLTVSVVSPSGQTLSQISQNELINNSVTWHEGTLTTSQTWGSNTVNAVDQTIIIASGVTLTIAPGAIVKFAQGTGIVIEPGGVLDASGGTLGAPIVFTSLLDGSVGGDTAEDGDASVPTTGNWNGITGAGQFTTSQFLELRYVIQPVGGTLTGNTEWLASIEYLVTSSVTVPSNITLTVDPGAVIKFNHGLNLTIDAGGTLIANGTVAQPIVFTSFNDASVGAITNPLPTIPASGDWDSIYLKGGQVTLDHVSISYGGGPDSLNSGLISLIAAGSVVSISDSVLNQGFYHGINAEYGNVNITNCVVTGCDRGIQSGLAGPTAVNIINCTVDNNNYGIFGHGGTLFVANTIVSDSLQVGVEYCCGSALTTFEYNDVWSAVGSKYAGISDQSGVNGNISANPVFVNAGQANYELNYGSPCINAGDGAVAPLTDLLGAPGYNYPPLLVKTGIANGAGIYPDMGAYEFSQNAPSTVDLIATSLIAPTEEAAGQTVTVQWNDLNIGSGNAVGPWHDTLSLVAQSGGDKLTVGTILVAQNTILGPGQNFPVSATVQVPGGPDGPYQWQVQVNSKGEVFEGANWTNNTVLTGAQSELTVSNLASGVVATNQLLAQGGFVWYSFMAPSNGDFQVNLNRAGGTAGLVMYIGEGFVPNTQDFSKVVSGNASSALNALISDASSQPYYVAIYAQTPGGAGSFTLDIGPLTLGLSSVTPTIVGNTGPVTLTISGGQLTSQLTYQLVDPHSVTHTATSVTVASASTVYATFDFTGLPTGSYKLQINGGAVALPNALSVASFPNGNLILNITGPALERPGRSSVLTVSYTNTGGTDMTSPILFLKSANGSFRLPGETLWVPNQFEILAIDSGGGPAGVLPPGYEGHVQVQFSPSSIGGSSEYSVSMSDPTTNLNWAALEQTIQPQFQPNDSWGLIFSNFESKVGTTYGQLQSLLAQDATYLGQEGDLVLNVQRLLAFEFAQDDNYGTITKRFHLGAFGRGAADPINTSLQTDGSGNVAIQSSGLIRYFTLQKNGSYAGQPGDYATLTKVSGAYQLREVNGLVRAFLPGGTLNYLADNFNTITAHYTGANITGLTDSYGNTTTYAYNANGRVSQTTDPVGRVATYTYDASGQHLLSETDPSGTTAFTWVTNQSAASHALASVTFPDGTHTFYQYDNFGRMISQSHDGGGQTTSYTYDSGGGLTGTDAAGRTATVRVNELSQHSVIEDGLGRFTTVTYDTNHQPVSLTGTAGSDWSFANDAIGNPVAVVDPLGLKTTATYDPSYNKLTSVTDPLGQQVSRSYDAGGDMTSEIYPDGSATGYQYDSAGNLTQRTSRRGLATRLAYDAHNLLTNETLADNSQMTFAYDAHRNLASFTDGTGTTSYTYDGADRVTTVTYPNTHSLHFTYNAGGQRTQMTDDSGFTVNYSYDAVGRLFAQSNSISGLIVRYTYDAAGRVTRKDFGNGGATTQSYTAAGLLRSITNLGASSSVVSRFNYSYDSLGRVTTMDTLAGAFAYSYDADDQLTSVTTPTGRAVTYQYDDAGNRASVIDNGTNIPTTTSALNQYVTVGATSYVYDDDGNLTSKIDPSGTNTYVYDDQNHLISLTSPGGTWTYQYNALWQRTGADFNGHHTDYVLDPEGSGSVVAEYNSGQATHYTYGLDLTSRVDSGGNAAYYDFDGSGNTANMTDASASIVASYSYLPYGEKLSSNAIVANPFLFAGQMGVMDGGEGIYFMRNRWYDPAVGHFTQADPADLAGSSINLYKYAQNNPVHLSDPNGLGLGLTLIGLITGTPANEAVNTANQAVAAGNANRAAQNVDYSDPNADLSGISGGTAGANVMPALQSTAHLTMTGAVSVNSAGVGATENAPGITTPLGATGAGIQAAENKMIPPAPSDSPFGPAQGRFQSPGNTGNDFSLPPGSGAAAWNPPNSGHGGLPPGGGNNSSHGNTTYPSAGDPNDKTTSGFGTEGFVMDTGGIYYTIDFANETNATAPAAEVVVTDYLDPNLDWSTFSFQSIAFNDAFVNVGDSVSSFVTMTHVGTDPNPVQVTATFDPSTGLAKWVIESIDPVTQTIPADPLAGFLPPDNSLGQGEGFLTYIVGTKAGLATGTTITNQAVVVFDVNPPIATAVTTNTIDASGPASAINPLPALSPLNFTVSWSGSDAGAGIAGFDIFVSANNGPWTPWFSGTTNLSAVFSGANSNTYSFYSVVYDAVGTVEANPVIPSATTIASSSVATSVPINIARSGANLTLSWTQGVLLEATNLAGPWSTNVVASPYTVAPTNSQTFFKLLEN